MSSSASLSLASSLGFAVLCTGSPSAGSCIGRPRYAWRIPGFYHLSWSSLLIAMVEKTPFLPWCSDQLLKTTLTDLLGSSANLPASCFAHEDTYSDWPAWLTDLPTPIPQKVWSDSLLPVRGWWVWRSSMHKGMRAAFKPKLIPTTLPSPPLLWELPAFKGTHKATSVITARDDSVGDVPSQDHPEFLKSLKLISFTGCVSSSDMLRKVRDDHCDSHFTTEETRSQRE